MRMICLIKTSSFSLACCIIGMFYALATMLFFLLICDKLT